MVGQQSPPFVSKLMLGVFVPSTVKILVSSSRPQSPDHMSDATVSSRTLDGSLAPVADFNHPPESSSCLDNSAAKHKLLVKPRNQRSSKMRRLSSVIAHPPLCRQSHPLPSHTVHLNTSMVDKTTWETLVLLIFCTLNWAFLSCLNTLLRYQYLHCIYYSFCKHGEFTVSWAKTDTPHSWTSLILTGLRQGKDQRARGGASMAQEKDSQV